MLTVADSRDLTNSTADNIAVLQWLLFADLNRDGIVDIYDAIMLANALNSGPGSPNRNPYADT
jgi:hypothetical protein